MTTLAAMVREACVTHGARAVSEAAYAAMAGRRQSLERLGLGEVCGIGSLHEVTVIAFGAMGPADRAADLATAAVDAARIKGST